MFIELRREITLLFSFGQIFEQKFTKLTNFLSICQLGFAFFLWFCDFPSAAETVFDLTVVT